MGMVPSQDCIENVPLCSVCIANYNGESFLARCIDSVLSQDRFFEEVEILVHDDASIDNSVDLIRDKYPKVTLLTSNTNVGFCTSNNRMVDVARGEFVLLLNNDAVLHKDALRVLYDASQKYGDGIFGLAQYNADTGELIDIGSLFDPFLNPIPNKNSSCQDVGMVIGACLWLPRNLWIKIGGFPEWFGSMAEDMFLCFVARLWGYPVKAIVDSGFDHWVGRSFGGGKVTSRRSLSTTLIRRSSSERNKTFVMIICYPAVFLAIILPFHLLLLTVEGVLLSIIHKDKRIWRDIYWKCLDNIWKMRKILFLTRKSVQINQKISLCDFLNYFKFYPHKVRMFFKFGLPKIKI